MSKDGKSDSKTSRIENAKEDKPIEKPGEGGFKTRTVQKSDDSVTVQKNVANKETRDK